MNKFQSKLVTFVRSFLDEIVLMFVCALGITCIFAILTIPRIFCSFPLVLFLVLVICAVLINNWGRKRFLKLFGILPDSPDDTRLVYGTIQSHVSARIKDIGKNKTPSSSARARAVECARKNAEYIWISRAAQAFGYNVNSEN
jgi:hypothetical protein